MVENKILMDPKTAKASENDTRDEHYCPLLTTLQLKKLVRSSYLSKANKRSVQ